MAIKEKKHLRRRSNWYIYLISFAATTVLLALCILAFWDVLFPAGTTKSDPWKTYIPEYELNSTVLFMMGDEQGSVPNSFMLMNYRPGDEVIALIPLNASTRIKAGNKTGKLTDLYKQGGADTLMTGIKDTFGIECDFYVNFDRSSFTGFTSLLGEIKVNIPFFFEGGGIDLHSGEHHLSGGELFLYMNYADFPQAGEDYNLVIIGSAISSLINTNGRHLDTESIQEAFNKILNTASTNLTFRDFANYQRALLYTSENSVNPANYYVPNGVYESDEFIISAESVANIYNRFDMIDSGAD
ncbi:MAG: LCP family protein [Oscillospiraceae bacterium]|nr:LCP family protein [Oscillospiraceae bacterium]